MNKKKLVLAVALALPAGAWALDPNSGDRENYVLRGNGTVLAVKQNCPAGDTNNACLVRRVPNGAGGFTEQALLQTGDAFAGTTIRGIGSNPFMNEAGVMVSQLELNQDSGPVNRWDTAMVTGVPGTITSIAKTLDVLNGLTACSFEPWPQINENNQVFFGTSLVIGSPTSYCDDGGDQTRGWGKAVYRYDPGTPATTTLLTKAYLKGGANADQVTTSDPRWVKDGTTTTFNVVDAHLIAQGANTVTDTGYAVARIWLSTSTTLTDADVNSGTNPTCIPQGYLWTDGATKQLIAMEAGGDNASTGCPAGNNGPYTNSTPLTARPFGYLGKPVANEQARVFFLTQSADDNDDNTDVANLWLWSSTGGLPANPVVKTGDAIPGAGTGVFNGFAPHQDLNNSNQAAFTAGLNIDGGTICGDGNTTTSLANYCRGVYFVNAQGIKTEIARTTAAAQADPATAARASVGDFNFNSIGSAAVLAPNGTVFFFAARGYPTSDPALEPDNPDNGVGYGNSQNGIFAWSGGKVQKLIAEGDNISALIADGQILAEADGWAGWLARFRSTAFHAVSGLLGIQPAQAATQMIVERLFLPMPELRQQVNAQGKFVVRAWLDTTGDGTADEEKMLLLGLQENNKAGAFWNNACHFFGGCGKP